MGERFTRERLPQGGAKLCQLQLSSAAARDFYLERLAVEMLELWPALPSASQRWVQLARVVQAQVLEQALAWVLAKR